MEKYPLTWPPSRPRTPANFREFASFKKVTSRPSFGDPAVSVQDRNQLSIADGLRRVRTQIQLFNNSRKHEIRDVLISTNAKISDYSGDPLSKQGNPKDPGAAVYFQMDGRQYCFPCDKWTKLADNLAAIAAHLEAIRGIERWGCGELQDSFRGYAALPASSTAAIKRDPWDVFEMKPTGDWTEVQDRYRQLARRKHPDAPLGTTAAFQELQEAYDFLKEKLQYNGE